MNTLALMLSAAAIARAAGGNPYPKDESLSLAHLYAATGHTGLAIRLCEQAIRNARPRDVATDPSRTGSGVQP